MSEELIKRQMTKAVFARQVSRIVRRATMEAARLADGMWNPNFCSSDAIDEATSFCTDIRLEIENIEAWCARAAIAAKQDA